MAKREESRQGTAAKAARLLAKTNPSIRIPSAKEKRNLLIAFAERNLVIYGKAFDAVKVAREVDLEDLDSVRKHFAAITLYEIKSTNRQLPRDFSGYFFALTGAEMLVAQSLKARFRFAFVNTVTHAVLELSLSQLFQRAKGIYPTWSISF